MVLKRPQKFQCSTEGRCESITSLLGRCSCGICRVEIFRLNEADHVSSCRGNEQAWPCPSLAATRASCVPRLCRGLAARWGKHCDLIAAFKYVQGSCQEDGAWPLTLVHGVTDSECTLKWRRFWLDMRKNISPKEQPGSGTGCAVSILGSFKGSIRQSSEQPQLTS